MFKILPFYLGKHIDPFYPDKLASALRLGANE